MVNCCVPGCTNFSRKTVDVSYHKVPTDKDKQLQKAWILRIRRENLPPLANCYVCSEHFEAECFEADHVYQELTGQKRKRRLKPGSVPSIFSFSASAVPSKRRLTSENRLKQKQRTEVSVYFSSAASIFWLD